MAAVGVASAGVGRVAWRRVCVDALEGALGRVYQVRFFRVDMVTRACLASNQGSRFLQYIQVPSARKRGKRGGGERERKEADCVYDARVMKERERVCVEADYVCDASVVHRWQLPAGVREAANVTIAPTTGMARRAGNPLLPRGQTG